MCATDKSFEKNKWKTLIEHDEMKIYIANDEDYLPTYVGMELLDDPTNNKYCYEINVNNDGDPLDNNLYDLIIDEYCMLVKDETDIYNNFINKHLKKHAYLVSPSWYYKNEIDEFPYICDNTKELLKSRDLVWHDKNKYERVVTQMKLGSKRSGLGLFHKLI